MVDMMLQIMKGAYCYIQPSDIEGLSPILLTAMGFGKRIICSDILENQFAVGDTAVLFKQGNIHSLKEKIEYLIDNPSDTRDLGIAAKNRAHERFTWDNVVKEYLRLFLNIT